MARDLDRENHVPADCPARLIGVHVQQAPVGRVAGRDHHVVDRPGQVLEEPLQLFRVVGVEGGGAERIDLCGRCAQTLGVPSGENRPRALGTGVSGGSQPDARAPADDDEGLSEQRRFAGVVRRRWLETHGSSSAVAARMRLRGDSPTPGRPTELEEGIGRYRVNRSTIRLMSAVSQGE